MAVGAVAFEFVPMHYDLWRYFGSQGLQIGDGVVWWGFANSHGIIGTAVVLSLLLKVLPERRQFLIVPLMPPIFLGVHSAGALFAYLTVGTTTNSTATFFGTLATDLLCCLFFWLYSQVVCAPASVAAVNDRRSVEHHEVALMVRSERETDSNTPVSRRSGGRSWQRSSRSFSRRRASSGGS